MTFVTELWVLKFATVTTYSFAVDSPIFADQVPGVLLRQSYLCPRISIYRDSHPGAPPQQLVSHPLDHSLKLLRRDFHIERHAMDAVTSSGPNSDWNVCSGRRFPCLKGESYNATYKARAAERSADSSWQA